MVTQIQGKKRRRFRIVNFHYHSQHWKLKLWPLFLICCYVAYSEQDHSFFHKNTLEWIAIRNLSFEGKVKCLIHKLMDYEQYSKALRNRILTFDGKIIQISCFWSLFLENKIFFKYKGNHRLTCKFHGIIAVAAPLKILYLDSNEKDKVGLCKLASQISSELLGLKKKGEYLWLCCICKRLIKKIDRFLLLWIREDLKSSTVIFFAHYCKYSLVKIEEEVPNKLSISSYMWQLFIIHQTNIIRFVIV